MQVSGVPDYPALRDALLPLAQQFAVRGVTAILPAAAALHYISKQEAPAPAQHRMLPAAYMLPQLSTWLHALPMHAQSSLVAANPAP